MISSVDIPVIRVKPAKTPLGKVTRIGRRSLILVDLAAASSDAKAEEILPLLDLERPPLYTKTMLPSAGLLGDREPSLERILLYI
jgi:hypothetical protein